MMATVHADLLETYQCVEFVRLVFSNGDAIDLEPGTYWTAAFGVVVDCVRGGCIATPRASWKLTGLRG